MAAIDRTGRVTLVEVKSCRADFRSDRKWQQYLGYCDRFYFAVGRDFPLDLLPPEEVDARLANDVHANDPQRQYEGVLIESRRGGKRGGGGAAARNPEFSGGAAGSVAATGACERRRAQLTGGGECGWGTRRRG